MDKRRTWWVSWASDDGTHGIECVVSATKGEAKALAWAARAGREPALAGLRIIKAVEATQAELDGLRRYTGGVS